MIFCDFFLKAVGISYDGSSSTVGDGNSTVDDSMEIDSQPSVSTQKRKIVVGTEQLSFRKDHQEIHYPLEDGLSMLSQNDSFKLLLLL